jgi:hypothetical protein
MHDRMNKRISICTEIMKVCIECQINIQEKGKIIYPSKRREGTCSLE